MGEGEQPEMTFEAHNPHLHRYLHPHLRPHPHPHPHLHLRPRPRPHPRPRPRCENYPMVLAVADWRALLLDASCWRWLRLAAAPTDVDRR